MQNHSSDRWPSRLLAGALLILNPGLPVLADSLTLDTNQSAITISGSIAGFSFVEQGAGSLTTRYGGTIQAGLAAGTIQFTGQSVIQAQNNGSWQPKADGTTGSEPANYGATANGGIATAKAALRNIQLDATSPAITVSNGQFDSASLVFGFPSSATSTLAYNVTGLISKSGAKALTGYATNKVTSLATLTTAGGQQTLTIPVDATFLFTVLSANDTTINLKGQLVAIRSAAASVTIQSVAVQNQVVTLHWQGAPGEQYQVHASADLVLWQTNAVNVTSSTTDYTWSGPATASRQFFRLAK